MSDAGQLVSLLPVGDHVRMRSLFSSFSLAPTDLLRNATYRRLWSSILISSFGGQVTLLAIPLTAAVLLQASSAQMSYLQSMELLRSCCSRCPPGCGSTTVASSRCTLAES